MKHKKLIKEGLLLLGLLILILYENKIETYLYKLFDQEVTPVQWTSLYGLLTGHLKLVILSTAFALSLVVVLVAVLHIGSLTVLESLISRIASMATTFPSVAIMALLVPSLGYGFAPVFIALSVYSFLPIYLTSMTGLRQIDKSIVTAAQAAGMNPLQVFYRVELPLAKREIISGVKTALIINISSATLGSVVGANTLGLPIVIGIRSTDMIMIFKGALPVALLAFLAESLLSRMEGVEAWQKA
jgi:osmoprotectant transport system permease protein